LRSNQRSGKHGGLPHAVAGKHGGLPHSLRGAGLRAGVLLTAAALLGGCRQDMHDQPKFIPLRQSGFYADGRSARPIVEGTVARGQLNDDDLLYTGKVDGQDATEFPFPVTAGAMARGRERYDIFCSPCHDRTGAGEGMVVKRGYRQPPSFHIDRLRQAPVGHFFDVMTNGFGAMPDYRAQIPVRDRWAIVAYIRALQASANATLDAVPPEERNRLAPGTGR
jgi:mono/diheme cytochrome c family protein